MLNLWHPGNICPSIIFMSSVMQANDEKTLRPIFTKYISPAIVHQILLDLKN